MKSDSIPYLKMQIERENKRKAAKTGELRRQRESNRHCFGDEEGEYGVELDIKIENEFQAEKHLDIKTEDNHGEIKKCNSYACIMTENYVSWTF